MPQIDADNFKYKEVTDKIIRGFFEVYNELGDGFLEAVYEHALYLVLTDYSLRVERQKDIEVHFRNAVIGSYKADLIVEGKVIIELKATRAIDPAHEAQLIHYLKATQMEVGMLLNFGRKPEFKRLVFNNLRKSVAEKG